MELFLSGYCRQVNDTRTVCVEIEDGGPAEADCCYPDCRFAADCTVAQAIWKAENGGSK